ncbi:hypothetical protein [Neolewinella sp.]|uniref:hypothetical protein n=1 Tax=Neolewinella sp. TaxID=2993543 RepID=UPI003B5257EF
MRTARGWGLHTRPAWKPCTGCAASTKVQVDGFSGGLFQEGLEGVAQKGELLGSEFLQGELTPRQAAEAAALHTQGVLDEVTRLG